MKKRPMKYMAAGGQIDNGADDNNDLQRQAQLDAINRSADLSSLRNDPTMQNMAQGMAMGTTAPLEQGAKQAIDNVSPELLSKLQSLYENPQQMVQTQGPMDLSKFQKLRDMLGLTGPIMPK